MTKAQHPRRRRIVPGAAVVAVTALLLSACGSTASDTATEATGGGTGGSSGSPAVTATRPAAPEGELPDALQTELQAAVDATMAEYAVPGAAVGVWIPGQGSWTTAKGSADIEGDVAASTELQWPLRSITKSYTVTLLLQLVDEGKLSLDDTVGQYVDGVTNGDEITLKQLANMSSGMSDYTTKAFETDFFKDTSKIYTLDELNSFALGQPAQFDPGTEYLYTNANTNVLGAVIEKVTGEPYADVLQERILDPLGQTGTQYITDDADWAAPHPAGYVVQDGTPEAQPQNPSIFGAAGSLFSTLDDGRVWAETLGSGALLKPGTQEVRQEGHPIPSPPYDQYALGMGETDGWWGHNGEGLGFTAAVFHDDETGASIVVYMNESNVADGSHPADQTFRALAGVLANEETN